MYVSGSNARVSFRCRVLVTVSDDIWSEGEEIGEGLRIVQLFSFFERLLSTKLCRLSSIFEPGSCLLPVIFEISDQMPL